MSVQAMAWALDHRQTGALAAGARLVLVSLADYSDPTGRNAWPSAPTLAHRLGITVRSVRESLALLDDLGLIRRGDQAVVAHIRADRRPVVWDLALDGVQVMVRVSGVEVDLGAEPYDRDAHGVTHGSPREPVDNQSRGERQRSHGVNAGSPKPSTNPSLPTPCVVKVTTTRASASHAVPRDPSAPIRSLGLTDPDCPTCGARIYRNHRCRGSALDPLSPNHGATVRELLLAAPPPTPAPPTLDLVMPPRGQCAWCTTVGVVNDDGVCVRCQVAHAKVGPQLHPLEDER